MIIYKLNWPKSPSNGVLGALGIPTLKFCTPGDHVHEDRVEALHVNDERLHLNGSLAACEAPTHPQT